MPSFSGRLEESERGGGRWVVVPFDVRAAFGEARPPVRGTVNGTPFRSRLAICGQTSYLGLTRAVREAARIEVGDRVEVVLERDEAPRVVTVPPALDEALAADAEARGVFDRLAFTHRKEYADWVGGAKREETRHARAAKAVAMLRAGVKHP